MVKVTTCTLLTPAISFSTCATELETALRVLILTFDTLDFFVASNTMRALSRSVLVTNRLRLYLLELVNQILLTFKV